MQVKIKHKTFKVPQLCASLALTIVPYTDCTIAGKDLFCLKFAPLKFDSNLVLLSFAPAKIDFITLAMCLSM